MFLLTTSSLTSIISINLHPNVTKNLEEGMLMRELSLAFKGLRYHLKKCICGGICSAVQSALRPISNRWNKKNA